ncbi:MAG: hypothetical protein QOI95_3642 [Acidimicrobiaceae bacterium]|jgi:hypothetical protein
MEITPLTCLLVTQALPFLASLLWTGTAWSRQEPVPLAAAERAAIAAHNEAARSVGVRLARAKHERDRLVDALTLLAVADDQLAPPASRRLAA